jgi:hypothetical protein
MQFTKFPNYAILFAATSCLLIANSCSKGSRSGFSTRAAVEEAHGLKLPSSARKFQQRRAGGFLDHGILSLFELDKSEVQQFVAQLKIKSRASPTTAGPGNPCVNGWNVWPKYSPTFVPGNEELAGMKTTWSGQATPTEMLSCHSPKGDWLHVEIWSVEDHSLIKVYTDWN